MGIEVDFSKIQKKIESLPKKLSNETIDKALDEGDKEIIKAMKDEVPKDTLELNNSLGVLGHNGSGVKRVSVLGISSSDRDVVERGYYQEYGTRRRIGLKWMKKAFEKSKDRALVAVKLSLINSFK